ncbi:hypothetical protein SAMN05216436_104224 [bacterium A37T11]|nr:hypothetical protein SAMN05216436_104224 [bacterium A37T11]
MRYIVLFRVPLRNRFRVMKKSIFWASVVLSVFVIWSCKRNDDEPTYPSTPISRLYVSFSDIQTDPDLNPFKAVIVFPKADLDTFGQPDTITFKSPVTGGRGIHFDPNTGVIFQGNIAQNQGNFNNIYLYSVSANGSIGSRSTFADTLLRDVRHLTFDYATTCLYVASKDSINDNIGYIHVYSTPLNLNSTQKKAAHQHLRISAQPWGLALIPGHNELLVSLSSTKQIIRIDSISTKKTGVIVPNKVVTISGALRLRGMTYSSKLDVLAVTDYDNGNVYVFENASTVIDGGGTVSPTRTLNIKGNSQPRLMDVAIDDRDGKNLLYVIDGFDASTQTGNRMLMRFPLSANGTTAPEISYEFGQNQTPYALSLDARAGLNMEVQ